MKKRNWMYRLSSKSMRCDGSTGTYGDNHGNQPFPACGISDRTRCQKIPKTQKVLNHDEMAQPPYG